MNDDVILLYVESAAALLGVPLDEARAQRVAGHLQRTAEMAELLLDAGLAPHDEPPEIYCPAPFLSNENMHSSL